MEPFWEPTGHAPHAVKYESDAAVSGFQYCNDNGLNFSASAAAYSEDDGDYTPGRRGKASRQDPLSHRIIEKRRRDRMNSCLADLSRLIPPQYQRKGRGRIEKTEIIEMSIRYMKQLQNQEFLHKENLFKMGYDECLQQAATFLYAGNRDICYQLVEHLKEKGDCLKMRNHQLDSVSASSGSPPAHMLNGNNNNIGYHHPNAPLSQLRDMLTTSDTEHSSDHHDHHHDDHDDHHDDHHDELNVHDDGDVDVKDLSLHSRSDSRHPQASVITQAAPAILMGDSASNHDFDSSASRSSSVHMHDHSSQSPPPRNSDNEMRSVRMRKLSDTSTSCHHDIEHNTVNSYKFKNYIQQRFSQDTSHHDENAVHKSPSPSLIAESLLVPIVPCKKPKVCVDYEHSSCDGDKPIIANGISPDCKPDVSSFPMFKTATAAAAPSLLSASNHSVPVFALHSMGRFYVPLTVEYDALVPYLGGVDLMDKSFGAGAPGPLPPLHSVNINVNYAQIYPRLKGAASSNGMVQTIGAGVAVNGGGAAIAAQVARPSNGNLNNCW